MEQTKTKDLEKKQADEKAKQLALVQVTEYCTENEIYFVTKDGKYWKYVNDSQEWVPISAEALKNSDMRLRGPHNWEQFLRVMQKAGRVKETRTYSFNEKPASVLNMMRLDEDGRPEGWIKPIAGEPHVFFRYLMTAISGSKTENALHIKQLLGWKYLYPATWQLPALAWFGAGGAGKNAFAEKILKVIFGSRSASKLKFKQIERFNEALAGKAVAFFDERPSRDDESALKFLVGQPTLTVEGKGLAIYDCDNTAWYILATNNEEGPIRLENNGTERRWSIIKTVESLVDVVVREEGVDEQAAREMIAAADAEIFSNPTEVAKFLNECVEEAKKLDTFPHALHGEDYNELIETQQDAVGDVLADVFLDNPRFEEISLQTLYTLYKQHLENSNPGSHPLAMNRFSGRVQSFLSNNKLSNKIKRTAKRVNIRQGAVVIGKSYVFYNAELMSEPLAHSDKSHFYLTGAFLAETKAKQKLTLVSQSILLE